MISREGIDTLISLIPEIESHDGSYGEHDLRDGEGTLHIGPFIFSPLLDRISRAITDSGLTVKFDWPGWQGEAERICGDPETLKGADLETVRKLLSLHLRKERFCEGHLAAVCESGLMLSTLERLRALRDSGEIEEG
jgi:hypothetical protein